MRTLQEFGIGLAIFLLLIGRISKKRDYEIVAVIFCILAFLFFSLMILGFGYLFPE